MSKIDAALQERLQKLINSMGFEFVGCEIQPHAGQLLFRLYIDKENKDGATGVSLEDCSMVSRQVSALLDVEDPIQASYRLEVSSPGIDRPLFELAHYQKFEGSEVKIRLRSPIEQRRQMKGLIKRVDGEMVYIVLDGSSTEIAIPFSNIEKGHLIGDVKIGR